jgi:hypothetical protein
MVLENTTLRKANWIEKPIIKTIGPQKREKKG